MKTLFDEKKFIFHIGYQNAIIVLVDNDTDIVYRVYIANYFYFHGEKYLFTITIRASNNSFYSSSSISDSNAQTGNFTSEIKRYNAMENKFKVDFPVLMNFLDAELLIRNGNLYLDTRLIKHSSLDKKLNVYRFFFDEFITTLQKITNSISIDMIQHAVVKANGL